MAPPRIYTTGSACRAQPCEGKYKGKATAYGLCSPCYQHAHEALRSGADCRCAACLHVERKRAQKARAA